MPWMDTFLKPVPWCLILYFSNVRLFNVVFWALEDLELAGFEWLTMIEVIIIIIQAIVINNMCLIYHSFITFTLETKAYQWFQKEKKKLYHFYIIKKLTICFKRKVHREEVGFAKRSVLGYSHPEQYDDSWYFSWIRIGSNLPLPQATHYTASQNLHFWLPFLPQLSVGRIQQKRDVWDTQPRW